jgi:hypothetical protein
MAATPSPNYNDQQFLASDPTFQSRVRQALLKGCVAIKAENPTTTPFHREREAFVVAVANSPESYKVLIAQSIVSDAAVIGDATVGGTVPLTSGNVAAQAALVTDAHIDAAIVTNFTSFFRTPGF